MRVQHILCFDNIRTKGDDLASKTYLHPHTQASAAVRCKEVVLLLLTHHVLLLQLFCVGLVFGHCLVVMY